MNTNHTREEVGHPIAPPSRGGYAAAQPGDERVPWDGGVSKSRVRVKFSIVSGDSRTPGIPMRPVRPEGRAASTGLI